MQTLALERDGKILIAGCFTTVNGVPRAGLARLHRDGSLDTHFNPVIQVTAASQLIAQPGVRALGTSPDGRMVIGGAFSAVNGQLAGNVARLSGGPVLLRETVAGETFTADIATIEGRIYILEFAPSLAGPAVSWTESQRRTGDGTVQTLTAPRAGSAGFYRLRVE